MSRKIDHARLTRQIALFLLSAATLTFEINLTRLFSIGQFYHFAFMIVSISLLGIGASGTAISIFPGIARKDPNFNLQWISLAASLSMVGSYLLVNELPFDSFRIAWEAKQVVILVIHYLALSMPFFFSGMAVGVLLSVDSQAAGKTYAVNLIGSAMGCAFSLVAPAFIGNEGIVILSGGLSATGAIMCASRRDFKHPLRLLSAIAILSFSVLYTSVRLNGHPLFDWLDLRLSPYKSLSYALQYPGAQIISRRWNSFSRVDLVRSDGIRSLPGLSYQYLQVPPKQDGLFIDGDELSPVVLTSADAGFSEYLPISIAFKLHPHASALILEPRGGLDIVVALNSGAKQVTAVEVNPLIVAVSAPNYSDSRLSVILGSDRSFISRSQDQFDIIILSLANSYHPVSSGAYNLSEEYRYTVESFGDALDRLQENGVLVVSRWLQTPPSECLRTFALAVTALEQRGEDPEQQIVAFRGYSLITILVKRRPFLPTELQTIRNFTNARAYDLVYAPDIQPQETNQYNVLPESIYAEVFHQLLQAQPREAFYAAYPYDVRPPTDDRPFFGHYFKWSQAGQVWAEIGKTWQPFGGAGYFVIIALLVLALILAFLLILLPVVLTLNPKMLLWPSQHTISGTIVGRFTAPGIALTYFSLIGLGYLLVEIPLIQRFILFLDQPAYALTTVLFSLLFFSGLGSHISKLMPRASLILLVLLLLITLFGLPAFFDLSLGLPLVMRVMLTTFILAPIGFLMGMPFPLGIQALASSEKTKSLIPLVWAANGAASVVSSILAALLALSFGFTWVFTAGALCYAGAWFTLTGLAHPRPVSPPAR